MSFIETAQALNPEIVERLRTALELGKWPDGRTLNAEQRNTVMETLLAWEAVHVPADERTGFIPRNECQSTTNATPADVIPTVTRDDA